MTIKVVLADDHPVVFEGLTNACGPEINISKRITSVDDVIVSLQNETPDVLVTEVRIDGQDALKPVEEIKKRWPEIKVVVFSGFKNPTYVARAAAAGCNDFVSKTGSVCRLVDALRLAVAGHAPPADSLIVVTQSKMRRPRQTHDHDVPLTNREMQVLRHVAMGLSNREIGKSLGISVETVKEHVQNILRKLDVNDRTQAAVWAVKRGLA